MIDIKLSDVIKRQAIMNIGTAGHVAHGKSTLVKKITGTATQRFKKEKERNITVRLGYANAKLFINPKSSQISAHASSTKCAYDPVTGEPLDLLYHISFVDCPGHEQYMSTMISGSYIMDYAIVVVAANEKIPQPQTHDHLIALDYSGLKPQNIMYVLNKLDLVKPRDAQEIYQKLVSYLDTNFPLDDSPDLHPPRVIYPISAATSDNISSVVEHLAYQVHDRLEHTIDNAKKTLRMYIVRSYNINNPSTEIKGMKGAVVGGTIATGILAVGDMVEIRPGVINIIEGKKVIQPLIARVESMKSDNNDLDIAIPGGLVGVNLSLYAGLSSNDKLKGQILGHVGHLPDMYDQLKGKFRLVGTDMLPTLSKLQLVVNGIMNVNATIIEIKCKEGGKGSISLALSSPVVMDMNENNSAAIMFNNKLVAAFFVSKGSLSMEVYYPEKYEIHDSTKGDTMSSYNIINDLIKPATNGFNIKEAFDNIKHIKNKGKTIPRPLPNITIVNTNSYISGKELDELLQTFDHDTNDEYPNKIDIKQIFTDNMAREFTNSQPRFNGEGSLVLSGRYRAVKLLDFINIFAMKIFTCPSCRGCKSIVSKTNSLISRKCMVCSVNTYLPSLNLRNII